ncbi:hypothetical protein C7212DRAFT_178061, partial [Tuber magnatum]
SIACVRCRRSKVKCVNVGPNTTCRACEAGNRECTYPAPVASGAPRTASGATPSRPNTGGSGANKDLAPNVGGASSHHGHTGGDRTEAPKKSKIKKPALSGGAAASAANYTGPKAWKEALDSPILNQALLTHVFEAFQLHHSPTLPFLHPPTFLSRLRVPSSASAGAGPSSTSPPAPDRGHSPLLMLGLLCLAARHVPALSQHFAPALPTPAAVSDFYASALKYRLQNDEDASHGELGATFAAPSLEKVQAVAMLVVHEWGMCRGAEAYVWLGVAIRMAMALGLSWDDAPEPGYPTSEPALSPGVGDRSEGSPNSKRRRLEGGKSTGAKVTGKEFTDKEVRRRTFWALFMLDRSLSSGRFRPSGIQLADAARVQLPCEERGFLFGEGVRTGFLTADGLDGKNDDRNGDSIGGRWEVGDDEGILAKVVRITEIWGRVQGWACAAGGRRSEKYPPWSPRSNFYKLQQMLDNFYSSLPEHLHFSPQTLSAHMSSRTSSAYAVMHITHFLCQVVMHREYIPFLPLRLTRPQGPLDPPLFPADDPETDREGLEPGMTIAMWWEESAKEIFRCARGIMQIVNGLEEWNSSVETPAVGFAVYMVGVCGVYAWSFPWMDQKGYITGSIPDPTSKSPSHSGDDEDENMEGVRGAREPEGSGAEARKAIELITKMRERWRMAEEWYTTLGRLRNYFKTIRDEYVRLHHPGSDIEGAAGPVTGESAEAAVARKLKQGLGGGFEEYRRFEKLFHDFSGMDEGELATNVRAGVSPDAKPGSRADASEAGADRPTAPEIKKEVKREGDVDALLLAAVEGVSTSEVAGGGGGDRWMAINTPRQPQQQQQGQVAPQPQAPTQGQADGSFLASLATYAADQEPMPQNNTSPGPAAARLKLQTPSAMTPPPVNAIPQQTQAPSLGSHDISPPAARSTAQKQPSPPPKPTLNQPKANPEPVRKLTEHEQLQREIDKGDKCGGTEDVAVFVNGRGITEWTSGDNWLGGDGIWEK